MAFVVSLDSSLSQLPDEPLTLLLDHQVFYDAKTVDLVLNDPSVRRHPPAGGCIYITRPTATEQKGRVLTLALLAL